MDAWPRRAWISLGWAPRDEDRGASTSRSYGASFSARRAGLSVPRSNSRCERPPVGHLSSSKPSASTIDPPAEQNSISKRSGLLACRARGRGYENHRDVLCISTPDPSELVLHIPLDVIAHSFDDDHPRLVNHSTPMCCAVRRGCSTLPLQPGHEWAVKKTVSSRARTQRRHTLSQLAQS
jgi:hypothetical protein